MQIKDEVNRVLYNMCCVKKTPSMDILPENVMAALIAEGNNFSEEDVITALEEIPSAKLSYRTYTSQSPTISLITYQAIEN